jgi:hypothetical protein
MSQESKSLELLERIVYKSADDIAISIGRSFERLEERMDASEARLYSRLAEVDDRLEGSRQELSDELGAIREEVREFSRCREDEPSAD